MRVAVAAVVAGLMVVPATASGASGDAAPTLAFLQAYQTILHETDASIPAASTAANRYVQQVVGECPTALIGVPLSGKGWKTMAEELDDAVAIVFRRPGDAALLSFARRVEPLRWSERGLTRAVRARAARDRAVATLGRLALPSICTDLHAWTVNGFRTVPPSTEQFLRVVRAAMGRRGSTRTPSELLRAMAARGGTALRRVRAAEALEERVSQKYGLALAQALMRLENGWGIPI